MRTLSIRGLDWSGVCLTALMLLSTAAMAADDKAGKALQRAQQKAQSLEQEKTV